MKCVYLLPSFSPSPADTSSQSLPSATQVSTTPPGEPGLMHYLQNIQWCDLINDFFSGEHPSLPELLRLKVPQEVGANYSTFGIILLDDQTGSRVNTIEHDCHYQSEPIVRKILQEWLEGKGLPVTWDLFVQTLRHMDLSVLANQIQASKMPAGEGRIAANQSTE